MSWLVTGASGYIGQHVAQELLAYDFHVIGMDLNALPKDSPLIDKLIFEIGDVCDENFISELFKAHPVEGIINLAALKSVEESIQKPEVYENVNYIGVKNLLRVAKTYGINYFIQSSTAAVYGASEDGFVDEESPTNPISPYGLTKLKAEFAVVEAAREGALRATALRYFNVIGAASPTMKDKSKANIIPKVLAELAKGQSPKIFGDDYPTPDGTCVRDYVHVVDLARAHVFAVQALRAETLPSAINIGTGQGYSVREIMDEILTQKGSLLVPEVHPRRPGDPSSLVARVDLAKNILNFHAEKGLSEMIASAI